MIKKLFLTFVFTFFTFSLLACGDTTSLTTTTDNNEIYSITVEGNDVVLVGESIQLGCSIDALDNTQSFNVKWESSDTSIAKVEKGLVTGVSKGEVTITASVGSVSGELVVKVITEDMLKKDVLKQPEIITEELLTGEKIELALYEVEEGYVAKQYNPYDYNQLNVYAVFTSPSGKTIKMPAFWNRKSKIDLDTSWTSISSVSGTASKNPDEVQGLETVKWLEEVYHYCVRVSLDEAGKHDYKIYVEEAGTIVQEIEGSLNVLENTNSNNKGILKVDEVTKRNFVDGNGETFMPVGVNTCWWTNGSRKTYDFDVWFEAMNANNINMTRIWMATWGFSLHWGKSYDNFTSRMNAAVRLDKVMELADFYDIYVQLCLINHGQFSSTVNPEWDNNPYNSKNGGPISSPQYFFTNAECKKAYKNELLYIIARYGYSDKIMAWELFNEVDWTDSGDTVNMYNIYKWHEEMSLHLNENDPYDHMITTSYKTNTGMAFKLDSIDYINSHDYGYTGKNVNNKLPEEQEKVAASYNKPMLQGEIGIDWQSGQECTKIDPNGVSIRQALWSGMLGGGAGAAMQWWWDSWIHPNNLWTVYKGAGVYGDLMDLAGEKYSQLRTNGNVTVSNSNVKYMGYQFDDRIYGYLYDNNWSYLTPNVDSITLDLSIVVADGSYDVTFYHSINGEVISNSTVNASNGVLTISNLCFAEDIAFIIIKK